MKKRYWTTFLMVFMAVAISTQAFAGTVRVTFPGVDGVKLQYFDNGTWTSMNGTFNNECTINIPSTATSLKAVKAGMSYQFDNVTAAGGVFNVPIIKLRVFGVNADCYIGVGQNNWITGFEPVGGGAQTLYNVFDNDETYTAEIWREGFFSVYASSYSNGNELHINFNEPFYSITVPRGVSDVLVSSYGWAVFGVNEGDTFILLKDPVETREAQMEFFFGGSYYYVEFLLDGSNPFDMLTSIIPYTVTFPGVEGVTLQYLFNGNWITINSTFDNEGSLFLPGAAASLRAVKGGMSYQFDNVTVGGLYNVPIIPLRVFGANADCYISVSQNSWIYGYTPVASGAQTLYNVFDNGTLYSVELWREGFFSIYASSYRTTNNGIEELNVDFGEPFYIVIVPDGVFDVLVSSYGWAVFGANEGDKIILLKDPDEIRDAQMNFFFDGSYYDLDFLLDGSNPFNMLTSTIPYTVTFPGMQGVTLQYLYNGDWYTLSGTFDNKASLYLPGAATSLRAVKGGMSYQFDNVTVGGVYDVP